MGMRLVIFALALLLASCSGSIQLAANRPPSMDDALPALASLDSLKGASIEQLHEIDVTLPLASQNTEVSEGSLVFTATATELAYAVYRISPPEGEMLFAVTDTSDTMWLLGSDYGVDHWVWNNEPTTADCQVDITELADPTSGDEYFYLAVVCPYGDSATLYDLALVCDSPDEWNLQLQTPNQMLAVLTWNELPFYDRFEVYRSTIPNDPHAYHVATVENENENPESFGEIVGTYSDMSWLPQDNDNETPGDPSDDFPSLAPGVEYYYHVVPISDFDGVGTPSPEVSGVIPWGARRTTRRSLPSTQADIMVFADQLLPNSMTDDQVEWCANNLVGTQKIFRWQADEFRAYNPDFMVLGYHLGVGAGDIGNVHGNTWDSDIDWPYVDPHDDWFITKPESTRPGNRVWQNDWQWYVTDPSSTWKDYLGANLLSMLGEDHFDGWFVDSCAQPWNTDPPQWWPDGDSMFGFWTPRLNIMLEEITTRAKAHPLKPYVIPNAGAYVTTVSDIKYYGDTWACDGIMLEGYGRWSPGNYFTEADWVLEHNQILDHQAHGLMTILQCGVDIANTQDRLFVFGSYLLIRGDHTYINWLGQGQDSQVGQWYPEFDIDEDGFPWGAPQGTTPATMDDLWNESLGLYRRSYTNGFVLVNPGDTAVVYDTGHHVQVLSVSGGGNISGTGEPQGSYTWDMANGEVTLPGHSALIVLDVFG